MKPRTEYSTVQAGFREIASSRNDRNAPAADATGAQASLPATPWLPRRKRDYDSTTPAPDGRFASVAGRDACGPVGAPVMFGSR